MWYEYLLNHNLVPDGLIRKGIRRKLASKLREESAGQAQERERRFERLVQEMRSGSIAVHTKSANEQHYEVPAEFFRRVLGARLKYSSGFWPEGIHSLDASEEAMLALYCERAQIIDGQDILDLGCGWGSLSLYLAEKYPNACITGLSNSNGQRKYIEDAAEKRKLKNLRILTADINEFDTHLRFDRVLSIEMFEHMYNYKQLLDKVASWMKPDGLLFLHIFCHKSFAYRYTTEKKSNWMARYFFTGGMMPSANLLASFDDHVRIKERWRVDGTHYQKTCEAWLAKMDAQKSIIMPLFRETYGPEALRWWVYWRVFFMACAELFGYEGGGEWFVSHYLLAKQPAAAKTAVGSQKG